MNQKNNPMVSVIVCFKNAEKTLEPCLDSIQKIDYSNFETILINDNSTDQSNSIAKQFAKKNNWKLIELKAHNGIAKARNLGIKIARGEFIAFTDSDCIAQKNWLKELLNGFSNESIASVGGPNLTMENESEKGKKIGFVLNFLGMAGARYEKQFGEMRAVRHNPSCNSMYRKKVLLELNGFNEKLVSNEDPELDFRLKQKGYQLLFNPKAIVWHKRRQTAREFFSQAYWYGMGRMQAAKLHLGMLDWFRAMPAIILILLFFSLIFSFFNPIVFSFFLALLLLSILFLLFGSIFICLKTKNSYFFGYLILLAAWLSGYALGTIRGVFE